MKNDLLNVNQVDALNGHKQRTDIACILIADFAKERNVGSFQA